MKIPLRWFSQGITDQYKITDLVYKDGFFYVHIHKGMHVIKHSDLIDFDRLIKMLKPHGYYPLCSNPGIWCHENLPVNSRFVWMISGLNIPILPIITIFSIPLKNTTQYQLIGEGGNNVALLYIWIMTENMSTSSCLAILKNPSTSFKIWHLRYLDMLLMTGLPQPMDQ